MKSLPSILILLLLTSCNALWEPMPKSWNWGMKPRPTTGIRGFPPADTDYGKGFQDGCVAAWDAVSKGLTGDLKPRFDYKRYTKNADYGNGWGDAIEHCTYIYDWNVT